MFGRKILTWKIFHDCNMFYDLMTILSLKWKMFFRHMNTNNKNNLVFLTRKQTYSLLKRKIFFNHNNNTKENSHKLDQQYYLFILQHIAILLYHHISLRIK